jgi:hypothetical protein
MEEKIRSLHPSIQPYVIIQKIGEINLYMLRKDYPSLREELLIHEKVKLAQPIIEKITQEMHKNENFRLFLCVDFQFFIKCITEFPLFCSMFHSSLKKLNIHNKKSIFKEINNTCIEELDEISNNINLKRVLSFATCAFDERRKYKNGTELDEPQIVFARLFTSFYHIQLKKLCPNLEKIIFKDNILNPFNKLIDLIGMASSISTDNNTYSCVKTSEISKIEIQNLFSSMQFHSFFEDYINSLFLGKGKLISNPLILFNPREELVDGRKIIDGYFELDGSILTKNNEIIFVECKNSSKVSHSHITNFLGKVSLIEKIYGLTAKTLLFSTGKRDTCFKDLESYKDKTRFVIYCSDSFLKKYNNLEI